MDSRLRLELFGGLAISRGEEAVSIRSQKARAILAYLGVHGGYQSRSVLAGLLWPDLPEADARTNLRKELSNLRRALSPFLDIRRDEVGLHPAAETWFDAVAFERLVDSADPRLVAEGVALYDGDFLDGFYVLNAPTFDEWTLAQRARLREKAVLALQSLAAQQAAAGARRLAVAHTRRLLALEPWHEAAHRQLMILLTEDGQRAGALAQYEMCRKLLAEELGVEPSAETTRLYEAIRDETLPLLHQGRRGGTPAPAIVHNLPPQLTPFVGRQQELVELERLLAEPAVRWVTVTGPGGMGKTRLALAAAERELDRLPALYPDGVYFVSLAPLQGADQLEAALALAVGLVLEPATRAQRPAAQQLADYCRDKKLLLVLDNFEHLQQGAEMVLSLLHEAPDLKVLLTSREAASIRGEHLYPLRGFARHHWQSPEEATKDPLVQLFVASARRVQPGFRLAPEALPALAEIGQLTGGLPLALELAAAWSDVLPLPEIARELQRGLALLEGERQALPQRHQSIRAAFSPSWEKLDQAAQAAFAGMSVFRGGFTRQAATAVLGIGPALLKGLIRKSLLRLGPDQRYQMHELLRQFAAEKLGEMGVRSAEVRRRHSATHCELLARFTAASHGPELPGALVELEAELANVLPAWRYAVKVGDWQRLAPALDGLAVYCQLAGRDDVARSHFGLLAAALAGEQKSDLLRLRLRAVAVVARHTPEGEQREQAFATVEEMLAMVDPEKPWPGRLGILQTVAMHRYESDRTQGIEAAEAALALADRHGTTDERLSILGELATMYHYSGQIEAAHDALRRARVLAPLSDSLLLRAQLMEFVAVQGFYQLRLEEAALAAEEGLALVRRLRDRTQEADFHGLHGWIAFMRGDFREAHACFVQELQIGEELGIRAIIGQSHFEIAMVLVHILNLTEADAHAQQAIAMVEGGENRLSGAFAQSVRAEIALAQGQLQEAEQLARESIATLAGYGKSGQPDEVASSLTRLALALTAGRRFDEARASLVEALGIVLRTRSFKLSSALGAAAVLAASEDVPGAAVELYAAASQYPRVRRSPWCRTVIGEKVGAAQEGLPPAAAAAAERRGQSADLWQLAERLYEARLDWQECTASAAEGTRWS